MLTSIPFKPAALLLGLCACQPDAQAAERLLLVERDRLLATPPSQTLPGQSLWDMHTTRLSRTSLIRLEAPAPALSHAQGERTLIILQGQVQFTSASGSQILSAGDYIAIAAHQPYQLAPAAGTTPLLLGFDVPIIDLQQATPASLSSNSERDVPVIRHQAVIMASPTSWNDPSDRGWTLAKSADKRVNLVEMFSALKNHSHPDADHSLILLEGSARVVTPDEEHVLKPGDYVSIPQNVAHKYFVEGDRSALFISFDAPAYDPARTLYLE